MFCFLLESVVNNVSFINNCGNLRDIVIILVVFM